MAVPNKYRDSREAVTTPRIIRLGDLTLDVSSVDNVKITVHTDEADIVRILDFNQVTTLRNRTSDWMSWYRSNIVKMEKEKNAKTV